MTQWYYDEYKLCAYIVHGCTYSYETQTTMDVPTRGNIFGDYVPVRYVLAILGLVGMVIIHGLNDNLSLTGASAKMMLNHALLGQNTADEDIFISDAACLEPQFVGDGATYLQQTNNQMHLQQMDGPLEQYPNTFYMKAFQYGYQSSLFIGARKAESKSAKMVMLAAVVVSISCTLLTPILAGMGLFILSFIRFAQGMSAGLAYPALHVLLAKWAPLTERGFMTTLVNCGKSMGPALSTLMTYAMLSTVGWRGVFVITGLLSVIWCFLWMMLVEDSPQRMRLISSEERNMIVTALGNVIGDHSVKKQSVPWRLAFKSPAFHAIVATYVCFNTGLVTLALWMPMYMKKLFNYDLTEDLSLMTATMMSQATFSIALSIALDSLRNRNYICTTSVRKIATGIATAVPALCLLAFCFTGCNRTAALVLWALAISASGGIYSGLMANIIDIAPTFAGTMILIVDTLSIIFIVIIMALLLFVKLAGMELLFSTIAMYIIALFIYTCWASSEEQAWSKTPENETALRETANNNAEPTNPTTTEESTV